MLQNTGEESNRQTKRYGHQASLQRRLDSDLFGVIKDHPETDTSGRNLPECLMTSNGTEILYHEDDNHIDDDEADDDNDDVDL